MLSQPQQLWFCALGSLAFMMQCIVQVDMLNNGGQWTNMSTQSAFPGNWLPGASQFPSYLHNADSNSAAKDTNWLVTTCKRERERERCWSVQAALAYDDGSLARSSMAVVQ